MKNDFYVREILYKLSSTGKLQEWSASVEVQDGDVVLIRTFGQVGGKLQTKKKYIRSGVNTGKSNEKTPFQSAVFQVDSLYKTRREHNWSDDPDTQNKEEDDLFCMLASTYSESSTTKKGFSFPVIVQPKLNGVRCTSYRHIGDDTMYSRNRKEYSAIEEIKDEVDSIFGSFSPDGEVYVHGKPLQEIVSLVKKRQTGTDQLEYWVYDLAIPDCSAMARQTILDTILKNKGVRVKKVPFYVANSHSEIISYHNQFVSEGYEGVIIRSMNDNYEFGKRPKSLMKYKEFIDSEFKIVGFNAEVYHDAGTDTYKNLILWTCETVGGLTFDVRPRGSVSERATSYDTAQTEIGRLLTVRYQELSNDNIPIFPVGLVIRDYE